MNKYIIPICNLPKSKVYNVIIMANSLASCQDKLMEMFEDYSDSDEYQEFIKDLDKQDILVGRIIDIETL